MTPVVRKVALMQPYFLPYVGYWQMLAAVDEFVVYDTVQFTRGSWVNRNRIRLGDQIRWLSLPLESGSHRLPINARRLAPDTGWRRHLFRQVAEAYRDAPHREVGLGLLERVLDAPGRELAPFLLRSLRLVASELDIPTPITLASALGLPDGDRQERVLAACRATGATHYYNLSGGRALYSASDFDAAGIALRFRVDPPPVAEVPPHDDHDDQTLSILDLVMRRDPPHLAALLADSAWSPPRAPSPDQEAAP